MLVMPQCHVRYTFNCYAFKGIANVELCFQMNWNSCFQSYGIKNQKMKCHLSLNVSVKKTWATPFEWWPRQGKRKVWRPPARWTDYLQKVAALDWMRKAEDRLLWRRLRRLGRTIWTVIECAPVILGFSHICCIPIFIAIILISLQ